MSSVDDRRLYHVYVYENYRFNNRPECIGIGFSLGGAQDIIRCHRRYGALSKQYDIVIRGCGETGRRATFRP